MPWFYLDAKLFVILSNRPPLRQYLLDGEFFVGAAISCTLAKLALRYLDMEEDKEKQNVSFVLFRVINWHWIYIILFHIISYYCMYYPFYTFKRVCFVFFFLQVFCANCMLIMASILHLGKSGLPKKVCAYWYLLYLKALKWTESLQSYALTFCVKTEAPYSMLLLFVFADYYRWWCGSHLTVCACCGRACSAHEEHLHCGVPQFPVFHAGRQQEGRGRENEQGTFCLCYLLL